MRGTRKRIVMITFCDSDGGAATGRTVPAGRPAAGETSQEPAGLAPGPFGIIIFPGSAAVSRPRDRNPGGAPVAAGRGRDGLELRRGP